MSSARAEILVRPILVAGLATAIGAGPVRADTLRVPADYATIQSAIDAATGDDTVLVSAGTYAEQIDLRGKRLTVRSASGPAVTIIDGAGAAGSVVTMASGEGPGTAVDGFTITGGTGSPLYFGVRGGGFFLDAAAPTVVGCVIEGNRADSGGGLYCRGGAPAIIDCTFRDNEATNGGGGLSSDDADLSVIASRFEANRGRHYGGGMDLSGGVVSLADSAFVGNVVTEEEYCFGGAVASSARFLLAKGCSFEGNQAWEGGAVEAGGYASETRFEACVFAGNTATYGGALRAGEGALTMEQCTVVDNRAYAAGALLACYGTLRVRACLLSGNEATECAGAIYLCGVTATVEKSTFSRNTAWYGGALGRYGYLDSSSVTDCLFEDNVARHGGAIAELHYEGGHFAITGTTFRSNAAASDGGAISAGIDLTIAGCTFETNAAGRDGGAVSCWNEGTRIEGCTFAANTAAGAGGAVFAIGNPTVASSSFCRNEPTDIEGEFIEGDGNEFCCPADLDRSGAVDLADVVAIVAAWGPCDACPEDLDEDGAVGMSDLFFVLRAWGACEDA